MKVFFASLLLLSTSAFAAKHRCNFGAARAVATFVNKSNEPRAKKIVLCQKRDGSKYVQITSNGFPGDITLAEVVVFESTFDETANGKLVQYVSLRKTSLLSSSSITVLAHYKDSNKLEIVKELGDKKNEVLVIE